MEEINTYDYYDEVFTTPYLMLSLSKKLSRISDLICSNEKNLTKENMDKFFRTNRELIKIKMDRRKIDSSIYSQRTADHCWAHLLKGIYIKAGLDKEIIDKIEDYMNENINLLYIL